MTPRDDATTMRRQRILGRLVLESDIVPGRVDVVGDRIQAVAPDERGAAGPFVCPGFVDIHVHGWGGHDAMGGEAGLVGMARALVRLGVTSFLPTAETAPLTILVNFAAQVRRFARQTPVGSEALGHNLEGPFISARRAGAQNRAFILDPTAISWSGLSPLLDGLRVLTIAPELDGAVELIRRLSHRGVAVSLGHSDASAAEAMAGFRAGARSTTHLFNAMSGLDHHAPGLAAAALADDRVRVELVADGLHVDPHLWPLVVRCASPSRLILVTDAIALAGIGDARGLVGGLEVEVRDGACRLVSDGRLAGSVIGLDAAVRNLVGSGVPLVTAVAAATRVPLDLIQVRDRGRIAPGQLADLVELDDDLTVRAVMKRGRWVETSEPAAARDRSTGTTERDRAGRRSDAVAASGSGG